MVWRRFIGVGGKGLSAISVLTHGRLLLGLPLVSLLTSIAWACRFVDLAAESRQPLQIAARSPLSSLGLLLGRHCRDRLFKFQPARPQRLGVLSALNIKFLMDGEGGRSSCWAFCNMPDTHDLLPHFCLVCWWSHCIIVPTRGEFKGINFEGVFSCKHQDASGQQYEEWQMM
ncbi:uncharacterized protein LOC116245638 isoform X5 [Nymphaea colorata]|uniref:uncharacterized protein LOC116245638 isoform X5 n=1 Tax=Nymphaea colorata TaxID=210225 RepID=UPI00129E2842|nr:uncharacterized protein LOC116245638 isoform X5 [Nymphaea colorata]